MIKNNFDKGKEGNEEKGFKFIHVRFTKDEMQEFKKRQKILGYNNASMFVRDILLAAPLDALIDLKVKSLVSIRKTQPQEKGEVSHATY